MSDEKEKKTPKVLEKSIPGSYMRVGEFIFTFLCALACGYLIGATTMIRLDRHDKQPTTHEHDWLIARSGCRASRHLSPVLQRGTSDDTREEATDAAPTGDRSSHEGPPGKAGESTGDIQASPGAGRS